MWLACNKAHRSTREINKRRGEEIYGNTKNGVDWIRLRRQEQHNNCKQTGCCTTITTKQSFITNPRRIDAVHQNDMLQTQCVPIVISKIGTQNRGIITVFVDKSTDMRWNQYETAVQNGIEHSILDWGMDRRIALRKGWRAVVLCGRGWGLSSALQPVVWWDLRSLPCAHHLASRRHAGIHRRLLQQFLVLYGFNSRKKEVLQYLSRFLFRQMSQTENSKPVLGL